MRDSYTKDPDGIEIYPVIWCSDDGTNDGTTTDKGYLQGETISSIATPDFPAGLTKDSENKDATTIQEDVYAINTIHNIKISGGVDGTDYKVTSRIVTSTGRSEDKTITIHVREK